MYIINMFIIFTIFIISIILSICLCGKILQCIFINVDIRNYLLWFKNVATLKYKKIDESKLYKSNCQFCGSYQISNDKHYNNRIYKYSCRCNNCNFSSKKRTTLQKANKQWNREMTKERKYKWEQEQ